MTLLSELREGLAKREASIQKVDFRVLLWGPADNPLIKKRIRIRRALRRAKIQAYTSEELSKLIPSDLGVVEQEDVHWRHFHLILALDFSAGPGLEIASYAVHPEFTQRTIVFHPYEWDPVRSASYGARVIETFPNHVPCTEKEVEECSLVKSCVSRAKASRSLRFREISLLAQDA